MRRLGIVITVSALLLLTALASTAAAEPRRMCAPATNLRDTPGGFIVGRLQRRQRVDVLRRTVNRRWTHVRTSTALTGWVPSGSLCRRG